MKTETLHYVILIVGDLDRALRFYTGVLGFPLRNRATQYAQLESGTTRLGLYERSAMEQLLGTKLYEPSGNSPAFELGFKVDNCDSVFADLVAQGAREVVRPTTRVWGQRTAYVRDPDGNLIELAEDLKRTA